MLEFPRLSTNAVAQYPFHQMAEYQTFRHQFLDRSEQRFPQRKAAARRWQIVLSLLNEEEMARTREFFVAMAGRYADFLFTDPWSGQQYVSRFASDELSLDQVGIADGRVRITITTSE